jgi:hypothetical protein
MSNIAKVNNSYDIDPHIWSTLKNSLYTGARDESIGGLQWGKLI